MENPNTRSVRLVQPERETPYRTKVQKEYSHKHKRQGQDLSGWSLEDKCFPTKQIDVRSRDSSDTFTFYEIPCWEKSKNNSQDFCRISNTYYGYGLREKMRDTFKNY